MSKILFVTETLGTGGVEKILITICNCLVENGFDVTILTLYPYYSMESLLDKRVRVIKQSLRKFPLLQKIPYIRYHFFATGQWEKRVSAKQLYNYYVKDDYDIEVGFFRGLSVKIVSGSSNPHSKKLAWVHSDFRKCTGVQAFFSNMLNVKNAYNHYNKIVCVSEEAQRGFNEVIGLNEKTEPFQNAISLQEIIQKKAEPVLEKKTKFTFLSVGRLHSAKSYDRLILATEMLNNAGYEFETWIVGEGAERKNLERLLKEKSIKNVKLLGSRENPYAYMNIADAYVCSSEWEGFNLTVAEALACSLPVVSTSCTGPKEILQNGEYGLIVDNTVDGLTEGMKTMLTNNVLRGKYIASAAMRARDFDIENKKDLLIALFK